MAETPMVPMQADLPPAGGSFAFNSNGTSGLSAMVPIAGNDKNIISAIGGVDISSGGRVTAGTVGLAVDNVKGHGVTLTKTHLPGSGDRVVAAGSLNVLHNADHKLDANAFAARTVLKNPAAPVFNTAGAGLDYTFQNKVGAGVSVAHTPVFKQTDYSATGNLNVFRTPDSTLDFKAGLSKTTSPYMPPQRWQSTTGFTFKKFF